MKNGVCGLQFDRPDISMNKFTASCLESQLHVFDARTQHPQHVRGGVCGWLQLVGLGQAAVDRGTLLNPNIIVSRLHRRSPWQLPASFSVRPSFPRALNPSSPGRRRRRRSKPNPAACPPGSPNAPQGFAGLTEKLARGTTVWGAAHLPQNRDVLAAHTGGGEVALYRYRYPDQRRVKVRRGPGCISC